MLALLAIGVIATMLFSFATTSNASCGSGLFSEGFQQELHSKKDSRQKEGFVSNQCPTTMIKQGDSIVLYNPKLAKIPGVNPIVIPTLEDYKQFVKWQRASGLNCPVLHLERVYDAQNGEQYAIRNSFLLDEDGGALNHRLPEVKTRPSVSELLDGATSTNKQYNQNQYPSYDPYNQNVGVLTTLDLEGPNPKLGLK